MTTPNQEPHRKLSEAFCYAVGGAAVLVGGYIILDVPPTLSARRQAEVTLAQIDACEQGDRLHDALGVESAPTCGQIRIVFDPDGEPNWEATRAPAEQQLEQSLIFPGPGEEQIYEVGAFIGAMVGLALLDDKKGTRSQPTGQGAKATHE